MCIRDSISVVLSTSCSLLHVPYTLKHETKLPKECSAYFAFAEEKLTELQELGVLADLADYTKAVSYTHLPLDEYKRQAYGYTQTMVKAAQQVVFDIRRDLFEHVQTLPLQFFDSRRHGDIMSLFTNDIDTMADALNNSFAMVIQSFIQIVGTLTLLYILNWRLSLIVTVCYGIMFWYITVSYTHLDVYKRQVFSSSSK